MSDTPTGVQGETSHAVDNPADTVASTAHVDIDPVLLLYDRFIPAQTESGDRIPEALYFSQLYVSTT